MSHTIANESCKTAQASSDLSLDQEATRQEAWVHSSQFQRLITEHPAEFRLGYVNANNASGFPLEGDSESVRSQAYDLGRALRRGLWS